MFAGRDLLLPHSVTNSVPRHSEESHFSIFKMPLPGILDPIKQEIKHEETVTYEMYANYSLWETAFFFKLNKYAIFENSSHITENRMIQAVRQQRDICSAGCSVDKCGHTELLNIRAILCLRLSLSWPVGLLFSIIRPTYFSIFKIGPLISFFVTVPRTWGVAFNRLCVQSLAPCSKHISIKEIQFEWSWSHLVMYEKNVLTWSFGSSSQNAPQTKDDGTLILLHDLSKNKQTSIS